MSEIHGLKTQMRSGIAGSLAGGIVFGMMMTMMGMVAMIVGGEGLLVGWAVHLVISLFFGVVLGFAFAALPWHRVLVGALWGVAAWIGGALIFMPLFLGMPGMVFDLASATPWLSLMGHMIYGLVAGGVAWGLERQTLQTPDAVAHEAEPVLSVHKTAAEPVCIPRAPRGVLSHMPFVCLDP